MLAYRSQPCPACDGDSYIIVDPLNPHSRRIDCAVCDGSGEEEVLVILDDDAVLGKPVGRRR